MWNEGYWNGGYWNEGYWGPEEGLPPCALDIPVTSVDTGIYSNALIVLGDCDFSRLCSELTLNLDGDELEDHAMGDGTARTRSGLFNWAIEAEFFQDFSSEGLDERLFLLYSRKTTFEVRAAYRRSFPEPDNPHYKGLGYIATYSPLRNRHGEQLKALITILPRSPLERTTFDPSLFEGILAFWDVSEAEIDEEGRVSVIPNKL